MHSWSSPCASLFPSPPQLTTTCPLLSASALLLHVPTSLLCYCLSHHVPCTRHLLDHCFPDSFVRTAAESCQQASTAGVIRMYDGHQTYN